jgi:hypothetical protein
LIFCCYWRRSDGQNTHSTWLTLHIEKPPNNPKIEKEHYFRFTMIYWDNCKRESPFLSFSSIYFPDVYISVLSKLRFIQWFRLFTEDPGNHRWHELATVFMTDLKKSGDRLTFGEPCISWSTWVHLVRKDNDMPVLTDPGEFGKGSNSKSPQVSVVHWSRTLRMIEKSRAPRNWSQLRERILANQWVSHNISSDRSTLYIYSYPTKIGKVQLYFTCKQQMSITIVAWIPNSQVLRA